MQRYNKKKYICHKCDFTTDVVLIFKNHSCGCHECKNCDITFNSDEELINHVCAKSSVLNSHENEKKKYIYTCLKCNLACKSKGALKLHNNIHFQGKFKCVYCDFVTNFKNLLKMHRKICEKYLDQWSSWSHEEMLEIYWCYIYAREISGKPHGNLGRQRRILKVRGNIDQKKLQDTSDRFFYTLTSDIRSGRTSVKKKERLNVVANVQMFLKKQQMAKRNGSFIKNNSKKEIKDKKQRERKRNRQNNSKVLSSNSKFQKDIYAEAKYDSQFETYDNLSSISNIEDAKLRDAHSSRTVASFHENLPEKTKKYNEIEAMDNSQTGMYDQLSSTSNNEKDKLRDAHYSLTDASFHENLPEHFPEKTKKYNEIEAMDNSQTGMYDQLSSTSNNEKDKLRDAHYSLTDASFHENLPEHFPEKTKKYNEIEAMDNSQTGMYDQLSSTSNNEKDKLREAHYSLTDASFQENLPEHFPEKTKKYNEIEAMDNSQTGMYDQLSSTSNNEKDKLRDAHYSLTDASFHENLPEHFPEKTKKYNEIEAMDNSQTGMYDQLSSTSNNEKDKLREAHYSLTDASFQENLTEHSSEKTYSTKEKNKSVESSADCAEYKKCYEDSNIIYSEKGKDQIMKELNRIKSENRNLSSQLQKLLISHELILSNLNKMMKQVKSESGVSDHLNSDKKTHESFSKKGQFQGSEDSVSFGLNANGEEVGFDTPVSRSSFVIEESNAQPIVEKELLNSNVNFQNHNEISTIMLSSTGENNCARSDATAIIPSVFSIKGPNSRSIDEENYSVQSDAQDDGDEITFTISAEEDEAGGRLSETVEISGFKLGTNSQSTDEENYPVQSDAQDDGDEITFTISAQEDEAGGRLSVPVEMSGFKLKDSRRRKYVKPKRPCPFCKEFKHSLSRHFKLMHKNEPEVKRALALPCDDRRKIFELLRKRGIEYENQKRLKSNAVQKSCENLICERKTHANTVRRCPICKGFYVSQYFTLHIKKCEEKYNCSSYADPIKFSAKTGHVLLEDNFSNVSYDSSYVSHVLDKFREDDIGNMCRTNKLLIYIGYYLFLSKAEGKSEEKENSQTDKKDIMGKMRLLCRLYLQFKSEIQKDVSLQEMFDKNYMTEFKRAVMKTLKNYKSSRHMLGFLVLKTLSILESRLSVLKREDESKKMVEFRKALKNNLTWIPLFGKQRNHRASRSQFQIKKPTNLPREEDMRKVSLFILNGIKKFSSEGEFDPRNFTILRRLLVTRITFLNARRGGEPCRLLISQWEEAKQDQWLNQDFVKSALNTKMEDLSLLNEFKIARQKGKGLKSVSVMIPKSCIRGLNIMSDSRIRRKAGIREGNKYLFPTTGFNSYHVQGVSDISAVMKESGVERFFKAKDIRHYVSTKQAMLTLPPEVRSLFYLHMEHEETINKNIYQSPLVLESLMKVEKILKILDESLISSDAISTENIDVMPTENENHTFESNSNSNFKVSENSTYMNNSEEMSVDDIDNPDVCVDEKNEKFEILKTSGRYVWTPLKRKRIMDEPLFKRYLIDLSLEGAKRKIPPKKHISIFLDKNKEIFNDKDEESRIKLVRSKIIGIRQTLRKRFRKSINRL